MSLKSLIEEIIDIRFLRFGFRFPCPHIILADLCHRADARLPPCEHKFMQNLWKRSSRLGAFCSFHNPEDMSLKCTDDVRFLSCGSSGWIAHLNRVFHNSWNNFKFFGEVSVTILCQIIAFTSHTLDSTYSSEILKGLFRLCF